MPERRIGLERQALPLDERRQRALLFLLAVVVARLLVNGGVAGEFQVAGTRVELVSARHNLRAHAVVHGVRHLGGQKAAPDQAVQTVLLTRQITLDLLGRQVDVRGADGLVRVLRAGLGLVVAGGLGIVALPVAPQNKRLRCGDGLFGDAQRVGTHVGDETHRALARDVHALIELLGDGHGAARRHVELARGLLL